MKIDIPLEAKNNFETDSSRTIKKVIELFKQEVVHMKGNRLQKLNLDSIHQQLLNKAQLLLYDLNIEELEKLYNEINDMNAPDKETIRFVDKNITCARHP